MEYRPLATLKKLDNNPRRVGQHEFDDLRKSLRDHPGFFEARPLILSDRTGELVIVAGNVKADAARENGLRDVPTILLSGLTQAEEREITIRDNAHAGEWDFDVLAEAWADLPLAEWGVQLPEIGEQEDQQDAEPATDRAAALHEQWRVNPGDLWTIGDHRLLCGDSTSDADVARLLARERPDLMVTDPPYGVEYDASWRETAGLAGPGIAKGKVTNDHRAKWCGTYIRSGAPVAYVWHAGVHAATVALDLQAAGYRIRSQIIWAKPRFAISRGDYHWAHEPCWYAVKEHAIGAYHGGRKQSTLWADIIDTTGAGAADRLYAVQIDPATVYAFPASATTVWCLPQDTPCDGGHSTQKPLECMARPIRNHGEAGQVVYDPFLGSGTTMVACQNLHRRCRGIEISPAYCAVILQRMTDAFPGVEIRRER
jgi:DNA modification methylase